MLAGVLVVAACGGETDAPIASTTPSAVGGAQAAGGGVAVGGTGGATTGTGGSPIAGGSGGGSSGKGGTAAKAGAAGKSGAGAKAGAGGQSGASGKSAGAGGGGSEATGGTAVSGGSGGGAAAGGGITGGAAGVAGTSGSGGTTPQGGGGTAGGGGCTATDDVPGEPEPVVPAKEVTSIEVDDTSVYWGALDGVFAAPKDGSGPVRTLLSQPGMYQYATLVEPDYVHSAALSFNGNVAIGYYPAPAGLVRVPRVSAATPEVVTTIAVPWGPFVKLWETLYFPGAFQIVLPNGSYHAYPVSADGLYL